MYSYLNIKNLQAELKIMEMEAYHYIKKTISIINNHKIISIIIISLDWGLESFA